jgi:hypothetical protein
MRSYAFLFRLSVLIAVVATSMFMGCGWKWDFVPH